MKTKPLALLLAAGLLASCGASNGTPAAGGAPAAAPANAQGGGSGWTGAPGSGGNRRSAVVTVQAETTKEGDLTVDNTAAGAVNAETQSSVAAGASGTVKALLRTAGDWVEAGTPVLQLDDAQLKLSLRLAQANLASAKLTAGVTDAGTMDSGSKLNLQLLSAQSAVASAEKNWTSAQALKKIGGISGSDYDNAQVTLQTAQANYEAAKASLQTSGLQVETAQIQVQQAQLNLAYATIKAPYAGQVSVVNVHPGEYVGPSTAVFGLVSKRKVVNFSVAPTDAPGLRIGKEVRFTYAGRTYPTRISQAPSAPVSGLVSLTADLPAGLEGAFGTVGTISYSVVLAHGTIVPLPALQSAENKTFVYTNNNGKAGRTEVGILAESGTYAAVTGLAGGVSVVLNPPPGLLIGAAIQPVGAAAPGGQGAAGGWTGQRSGGANGQGSGPAAVPANGEAGQGAAPVPGAAPAGGWTGQRKRPAAGTGTTDAPAAPSAGGQ